LHVSCIDGGIPIRSGLSPGSCARVKWFIRCRFLSFGHAKRCRWGYLVQLLLYVTFTNEGNVARLTVCIATILFFCACLIYSWMPQPTTTHLFPDVFKNGCCKGTGCGVQACSSSCYWMCHAQGVGDMFVAVNTQACSCLRIKCVGVEMR